MNVTEQKEDIDVLELVRQAGVIGDKLAQIAAFHNLENTEIRQFTVIAIDNHGNQLDFSVANIALSFPQALFQAFGPVCRELFDEYERALEAQLDTLVDQIKQA